MTRDSRLNLACHFSCICGCRAVDLAVGVRRGSRHHDESRRLKSAGLPIRDLRVPPTFSTCSRGCPKPASSQRRSTPAGNATESHLRTIGETVIQESPARPVVLIGHSMGGNSHSGVGSAVQARPLGQYVRRCLPQHPPIHRPETTQRPRRHRPTQMNRGGCCHRLMARHYGLNRRDRRHGLHPYLCVVPGLESPGWCNLEVDVMYRVLRL